MIDHHQIITEVRRAFSTGRRFHLPPMTGADLRRLLAGLKGA